MGLLKKLPSYDYLLEKAAESFKRFPLTLILAVFGTVMALYLIEHEAGSDTMFLQQKFLFICALSIPLSIALTFLSERLKLSSAGKYGMQAITVLFMIVYYFSLSDGFLEIEKFAIRFVVLFAGFHFLVACLPYIKSGGVSGFWQYNKNLFLKFLIAGVFSNVLMYGLFIALAAGDHLFGMDIDIKRYPQIGAIVAGIINTWMFLSMLPKDIEMLESETSYPTGIKVFAQYILMPLVLLYFVILIAYEAKIIVEWNWPKGWVSNLVLWYSVVGIFSLLLLDPIREKLENKWIKVFSTWFYRLLVPLVVMLFLAIWTRIADYGITESRYYVLSMAVGLAIVVLYFIFSKKKDIRIIPIVLALFALLSCFGPWSAFSISKNNQSDRLVTLMTDNGILVDGMIKKTTEEVSYEDEKSISSIVSYLHDRHGMETFNSWFDSTTFADIEEKDRYLRDKEIVSAMGVKYLSRYNISSDSKNNFSLSIGESNIFKVTGYDYSIHHNYYDYTLNMEEKRQEYLIDEKTFDVIFDPDEVKLSILVDDVVEMTTDDSLNSLKQFPPLEKDFASDVPREMMTLDLKGDNYSARLVINILSGEITDEDKIQIKTLDLYIFLTDLNK